MYIYPDNLKSKAVLWLWELRDIAIIGVGALISVFAMAQLGFLRTTLEKIGIKGYLTTHRGQGYSV